MKPYLFLGMLLCRALMWSQHTPPDTLKATELSEVILIGRRTQVYQHQDKPLMSVDEYLGRSSRIAMVRRGNYALEPTINNMATERTVVTIDGMRIFGACTDKMDPVTSYVEVSNLSEASVVSGAQGNCHGSAIGGAIDLKRNRGSFSDRGWNGALHTGFESNALQRILGASANFNGKALYSDTDFMIRKAENYKAGNGQEIAYSQFSKFNISATSGILIAADKVMEASIIYDKATDVGYPALPMDVSLAEALILSAKFDYRPKGKCTELWETKLYFNTVTHRMDDTARESVPIHMDMPGWTKTAGGYSKWSGIFGKHGLTVDANGFLNQSLAEMTMYPTDPEELNMFMQTWPDVRTAYVGLFAQDKYAFSPQSSLTVSATLSYQVNVIESNMGLQSLKIFYPGINSDKSRLLKTLALRYGYARSGLDLQFGVAMAERAPSVSEGYGFYLFNSFDGFDYIGNPTLSSERSVEINFAAGYKKSAAEVKITASAFRIANFITAMPDQSLIPMTIGANGVKVTTALDHALIAQAGLEARVRLSDAFGIQIRTTYSYGQDNGGQALPSISPIRYESELAYRQGRFVANLGVYGHAAQRRYNTAFGEDRTPAYGIMNLSGGHTFGKGKWRYDLKCGVDNLFDAYYSTFSDWNNLARPGRNAFVNLTVSYI